MLRGLHLAGQAGPAAGLQAPGKCAPGGKQAGRQLRWQWAQRLPAMTNQITAQGARFASTHKRVDSFTQHASHGPLAPVPCPPPKKWLQRTPSV